jgi:hypothetical protein
MMRNSFVINSASRRFHPTSKGMHTSLEPPLIFNAENIAP